jgi:hypothetical protein
MKHEKSGDPIYLPLSPPLVTFLVSGSTDNDSPCPSCGAQSEAVGYHGHGMHCARYNREEES